MVDATIPKFLLTLYAEVVHRHQIMSWSKLQILGIYTGAFLLVLGFHSFSSWINQYATIAWNETWPVNIFWFDFPGRANEVIFLIIQIGSFAVMLWLLRKRHFNYLIVIIFSCFLILGSNLTHSWGKGLRLPHSGPSQYFANVDLANQPIQFLAEFNKIQSDLSVHSRSHPPGAVFFYALIGALQFGETGMVSMWILLLSTVTSGYFLFKFFDKEFSEEKAGMFAFLFLLIPGVMIYFCASLDAIIVALTIIFIYLLRKNDNIKIRFYLTVLLFLLTFLNFGMLFIFPVFWAWETWVRKMQSRFFMCIACTSFIYLLLFFFTGYNQADAFFAASSLENERGFELFNMPVLWLVSRIQGILELLIFTGPFFIFAAWNGVIVLKKHHKEINILFISGLITFAGILFSGAYHCGETGRACLYIYPFLFLPVIAFFNKEENSGYLKQAPALFFGQALFMQVIGNYFW